MQNSLKTRLYALLKSKPNEWVHKERLSEHGKEWGYISENCGRRLRELVNENPERIEVELKNTKNHGKTAYYRYIPSKYELFHHRVQSGNYQPTLSSLIK